MLRKREEQRIVCDYAFRTSAFVNPVIETIMSSLILANFILWAISILAFLSASAEALATSPLHAPAGAVVTVFSSAIGVFLGLAFMAGSTGSDSDADFR